MALLFMCSPATRPSTVVRLSCVAGIKQAVYGKGSRSSWHLSASRNLPAVQVCLLLCSSVRLGSFCRGLMHGHRSATAAAFAPQLCCLLVQQLRGTDIQFCMGRSTGFCRKTDAGSCRSLRHQLPAAAVPPPARPPDRRTQAAPSLHRAACETGC